MSFYEQVHCMGLDILVLVGRVEFLFVLFVIPFL
jgi:hypothetical protein